MASTKKKAKAAREARVAKARESGFDTNTRNDRLPGYNALFDSNLRHYFENRRVQKHLYANGMIDREGRIIDLEKNKAKLSIIEQEFKSAEREEDLRLKEEEEMRKRVQQKRHEALDRARLAERMAKMREDRRIRHEIVRVTRGDMMVASTTAKPKKKKKVRRRRKAGGHGAGSAGAGADSIGDADESAFFVTEAEVGRRGDDGALGLMGEEELDEY